MKNNIRSAFRVLKRFRLYTAINIAGLALSLACATIVIRYIHQELTVDHFMPALDRTYILTNEFHNQPTCWSSNWNPNRDPNFKDPLDAPDIELSSMFQVHQESHFVTLNEQSFPVQAIAVDSNFIDFFTFPIHLGKGRIETPHDAVLTRHMAALLFGDENPIGHTLTYSNGDILTVVGVIDEKKHKSSLHFDLLVPIPPPEGRYIRPQSIVRLVPGSDVDKLNADNAEFMTLRSFFGTPMRMQFYPYKKLYFNNTIGKNSGTDDSVIREGNINNIKILSIVAILLLVIGVFNFINIYTVLMLKRAREFGIKKVYGAAPKNIFAQIYTENLMITLVALFLSWFMIEITTGLIQSQLAIYIHSNWLFDTKLSLLILILFPILISVYPALKYKWTLSIHSIRSVYIRGKSGTSRVIFLFIQYIVTFCLIVISLFFVKQLFYMLNIDHGYRTKEVMQCTFLRSPNNGSRHNEDVAIRTVIKQRIEASTLFEQCAFGDLPHHITPYISLKKDDGEYQLTGYLYFSQKGMEFFDFQLLEGRIWDDTVDRFAQYRIIINETAKKTFGITDITSEYLQPEQRLWYSLEEPGMDKNPPYEIVGVIKDFKTNHLSKANIPVIIMYTNEYTYYPFLLTIAPGKRQEAIAFLQELYNELIDTGYLEYDFLEDKIAAMYKEDKQVAHIYVVFAIIAIFISCLGLFGLSLFDIRQHYRSIALRKVNGATSKDIWPLLIKKYVRTLGVSFIISIPLSYYAIHRYLESFAHKAPVSWWLFAVAAILVMLVSYATLVWQVKKAISINPVEVLKVE